MPRTRTLTGVAGSVALAAALAGCSSLPVNSSGPSPAATRSSTPKSGASRPSGGSTVTATPPPPAAGPVHLKANVSNHATGVKVDTVVRVRAAVGTVSEVKLSWSGVNNKGAAVQGKVDGTLSKDGTTWTADDRLEPSATYKLAMTATNGSDTASKSRTFTTQALGLDQQTFPTVLPLKQSKVGVGMPVVVNFDLPVTDRAEFERHLHVTSVPAQTGIWNWLSDRQVHFRPETYWQPGTKVSVAADVNGVAAGNGIYGQQSAATSFTVGRSLITKVDLAKHVAKVYRDGKLVRTIPVTGGKPGWESRSGTKLIMAKEYNKVMTNEMIGAKEKYSLVAKYALRVTNSGEFLHAAPWSIANLGVRNASHGCVGMSVANAGWLYENSLVGDPVVTTGTKRGLEQGNGYADWDISYARYAKGSAL